MDLAQSRIAHPARAVWDEDQQLEELHEAVLQLFGMVTEALRAATDVFLATDREAARALMQREELIDNLHRDTQARATRMMLRAGEIPVATRTELLLILGLLPELERSGDLAEHIASHAVQGLTRWISERAKELVAQMGGLGCEMWGLAADAYTRRDPSVADLLRARDDEIDDLHVSLTAELAAGQVSVPVAIEMALVARYFERLGDHAVNVTRRLASTGTGPRVAA